MEQLHKAGGPEFLNRIGNNNIIIFDFIHEQQAKLILDKQIKQICDNLAEQRHILFLCHRRALVYRFLLNSCYNNLEFGGRGWGNVVEHDFITPLSRELSRGSWQYGDRVILEQLLTENRQSRLTYSIVKGTAKEVGMEETHSAEVQQMNKIATDINVPQLKIQQSIIFAI